MTLRKVTPARLQEISALSDSPIDWAAILQGQKAPTINFNFSLDDPTTRTIYIATGILSTALIINALIKPRR